MGSISQRLATLALSLAPKFGIKSYLQLMQQYDGDLEQAYQDQRIREIIVHTAGTARFREIVAKTGDEYVCIWEDSYPSLLQEISDPPIILYYKGDFGVLRKPLIGVVGTRKSTTYGQHWCDKYVTAFCDAGFAVVSGMAFGIDKQAHVSAMHASEAATVAVLASDVNSPSPISNRSVYQQILNTGGLILSATPAGVEIKPGMFASRNRIIAGLSRAVLIVEAGNKSGALITGNLAFDYDRQVFAIPGDLSRLLSRGCNRLIKANVAKLTQSPADVFEELGYQVQAVGDSSLCPKELSSEQRAIVEALMRGMQTVDSIKQNLPDVRDNVILSQLSAMELAGLIARDARGFYQLIVNYEASNSRVSRQGEDDQKVLGAGL